MWNAGKVTSTECKGRRRDPYKQETLANHAARTRMQPRHKQSRDRTQVQNNSNNLLSTNVLLCFPSCEHQQLLMRHQCLSPRYGSDQQPDLAQGTVCLMESQRARIRVSELVWCRIFRVAWLAWVAVRETQKYMSVVGGASFSYRREASISIGPTAGMGIPEAVGGTQTFWYRAPRCPRYFGGVHQKERMWAVEMGNRTRDPIVGSGEFAPQERMITETHLPTRYFWSRNQRLYS